MTAERVRAPCNRDETKPHEAADLPRWVRALRVVELGDGTIIAANATYLGDNFGRAETLRWLLMHGHVVPAMPQHKPRDAGDRARHEERVRRAADAAGVELTPELHAAIDAGRVVLPAPVRK